jgi:phosphatidate phosphatase PAH1
MHKKICSAQNLRVLLRNPAQVLRLQPLITLKAQKFFSQFQNSKDSSHDATQLREFQEQQHKQSHQSVANVQVSQKYVRDNVKYTPP